jgi:hypothetical protein
MPGQDAYSFFKGQQKPKVMDAPPAMGEVRVDCYKAIVPKLKFENPGAHFEEITATVKSPLSPTWNLLMRYKPPHNMPFKPAQFQAYIAELEPQLRKSRAAMMRLHYLAGLVRSGKTVFLVCYEIDPEQCHRSLVKRMLEEVLPDDEYQLLGEMLEQ